jgi:hypothetical protein
MTRYRLWPLLVFLLFGLAGSTAAAATDVHIPPVNSPGSGLPFAIADFDGDFRPDVASVRAGEEVPGGANYSIQLRLTSAGLQTIEVGAPAGGLVIEARDVNGDDAIDLVVATAWFKQPVAIFLNDGRGSFSRVEPKEYPWAFVESKTNWGSNSKFAIDTFGVATPSGAGVCPRDQDFLDGRSTTGSISYSSADFLAGAFLICQPGRAPPSEVSYL